MGGLKCTSDNLGCQFAFKSYFLGVFTGSASMISLSGEKKCACVEELLYLGHAANVLCTASSASDSRGKMMLWHIVFV